MKIVILDAFTVNQGDLSWKVLEKFGELEVYDFSYPHEIIDRAKEATVILTNKCVLNATHFAALPMLKYIGVLATGYNVIDTQAAKKHGITVCNVRNYGANSVAQHVFALLLELVNHVGLHHNTIQKDWTSSLFWCYSKQPMTELAGKTLGIIGLGAIGKQVAKIGKAFGMKVIALESFSQQPTPTSIRRVSLDELLQKADVISLNTPLTTQNQQFINQNTLKKMKKNALLINTSRGGLINEQDLADALNNGQIAGAGLDVLSVEPPTPENPLFSAQNCIITPHNAWLSKEARQRLLNIAVDNLAAFLKGNPKNVVE